MSITRDIPPGILSTYRGSIISEDPGGKTVQNRTPVPLAALPCAMPQQSQMGTSKEHLSGGAFKPQKCGGLPLLQRPANQKVITFNPQLLHQPRESVAAGSSDREIQRKTRPFRDTPMN